MVARGAGQGKLVTAGMTFLLGILMCGSAVMIAWHYWRSSFQEARGYSPGWFVRWVIQGLALPCLLWVAMNAGLFWTFGPFMPEVSMAQAARKPWVPLLFFYAGAGVLIVASYWLALSMAWRLAIVLRGLAPGNGKSLLIYALIWSVLLAPISACMVVAGGWELAGLATALPLLAITHSAIPLSIKQKPFTSYTIAIGKLKFGKVQEAEREILKQLDAAEDDFEGWLLLAEVYATQFKDLPAADQTVRDLCAQPGLNAGQIVTALHRLAEWHLQIGENPAAARETLAIICNAYPETHLARMARLRIDQLPASRKELMEQRQVRKLRLPTLRDGPDATADVAPDRTEAGGLANELVSRLTRNPDDVAARERLAQVFAEGLGRYDLGIEQIELLLEIATAPEEKRPQWLSQIASWQLKSERDGATGRRTLERLIEEYPQSAQAFAAQRRLLLLDMERKIRRAQMAAP